jgi:hypothetical protein
MCKRFYCNFLWKSRLWQIYYGELPVVKRHYRVRMQASRMCFPCSGLPLPKMTTLFVQLRPRHTVPSRHRSAAATLSAALPCSLDRNANRFPTAQGNMQKLSHNLGFAQETSPYGFVLTRIRVQNQCYGFVPNTCCILNSLPRLACAVISFADVHTCDA